MGANRPIAGSLVAVPLPSGHLAIVWMVAMGSAGPRAHVRFVIMDGFHATVPKDAQLSRLRVAECPGGVLPGMDDVWKGCFFGRVPNDFAVIGARALPQHGHAFFAAEGTMVFQSGEHLRKELHRSWRLIHDRAAVEAEWAKADARAREIAEKRRRTRTLPSMMNERAFAKTWPKRAAAEARRIFREATADLIALQSKGTKRQRAAVLKRVVTEFNALDDRVGCMETVEREQVVARVEELAALVGLSNEDEALTGHRDW